MVPADTPLMMISTPVCKLAASGNSASPGTSARISASCRQLRAVTRNKSCLPPHAHVSQHETGAAGAPDAVAEIIRHGTRVGADPHLIECVGAAGAHHRAEQAWVLIADHGAQPLHRPRIHGQRLVAIKTCGELHAP